MLKKQEQEIVPAFFVNTNRKNTYFYTLKIGHS